jgi:hypothetical protein
MLNPPFHTLGVDECGEQALHLLPATSMPVESILIFGKSLRKSDAWTGTVLKTGLEYHCTHLGNSVTLEPPDGPGSLRATERLFDLLGPVPRNFYLADDQAIPALGGRGRALLPALPISDAIDAVNAADAVLHRCAAFRPPVSATVATAVAIFVDNALTHADSPVGVITTVAFEPASNSIQVVSSDLGSTLSSPDQAELFLHGLREKAVTSHSSFAHLMNVASRRGEDVSLTLAASAGRLTWGSSVASKTTFEIPGFTAALRVANVR